MRSKLKILCRLAMLFVIVGFFMPVACEMKGPKLAKATFEFAEGSPKGVITGCLIWLVFIVAVIMVLAALYSLYNAKKNKELSKSLKFDWFCLVCEFISAMVIVIVYKDFLSKDTLNAGAYVILVGYVISLIFLIAATLSKDKEPDKSEETVNKSEEDDILIDCPYCSEKIRLDAAICIHCGENLAGNETIAKIVHARIEEKKRKEIGDKTKIPLYGILSNEQLALMAQNQLNIF